MISVAPEFETRHFSKTDVLVIGAGLLGCATAYYLARFGCETLVIDRSEIGAGASGATSGNLHLQLSPATHENSGAGWMNAFAKQFPFFVQAIGFWKEVAKELPRDIELRFPGGLMVAKTKDQMSTLAEKVALERTHGLKVELLGRTELNSLAPYIADRFLGASWCAEEGMANSLIAVIAFAEAARAAGVRFLLRTEVHALSREDDGWAVATQRGTIHCRRLVIAGGHSSDSLGRMVGISIPITSRPIHVGVTEPVERFVGHLVYHTAQRMTLKQVANGNLILGGGWPAATDPMMNSTVLRESVAKSVWVAQDVVPAIGKLQLIRTWAERNVYTPDGWPILGLVPGKAGLYLAVCNTYGFTQGPICGLLVAEAIVGRKSSVDLSPFLIERFEQGALSSS
jgi:glycine/D-amino acid oxidase-like deaminating enzyme